MAKRIIWTDQAKADVRAIERKTALQILKTLARFAQTEQGNVRQLAGIEPPQSGCVHKITGSSSWSIKTPSKSFAFAIARRPTANPWAAKSRRPGKPVPSTSFSNHRRDDCEPGSKSGRPCYHWNQPIHRYLDPSQKIKARSSSYCRRRASPFIRAATSGLFRRVRTSILPTKVQPTALRD